MALETEEAAVLNVEQLTVAFQYRKNKLVAVDEVHFRLQAGLTLALLGESGCGKSMTSLALMRLLLLHSAYGSAAKIELHHEDILKLPEDIMRSLRGRKLAMIFQEPMSALNPVLNIGQQLKEAVKRQGIAKKKAIDARMLELLRDVELTNPELRLKQYPHQLSGGQKQRVMIAMALAGRPDVLIADEPTTALDVSTQAQILALLKKLQITYGMSILLITHDLKVVESMADYVCLMYAGQVVESSPALEFFNQPLHPYAQQLFLSLPDFSKRKSPLPVIKGQVPSLDNLPTACRFHPRCAHAFELCTIEEPKIQAHEINREVRCHLYLNHQTLPP